MILDEEYVGRDGFTTIERFFQKIEKSTTGCWEWTGSRYQRYGFFKFKNKNYTAHKFSYFLETGYMPTDKEYVCHNCDNTYCVNPSHLFLGTQYDNMQDMVKKGRSPNNKGERNPNSKIGKQAVDEIRRLYPHGFSRQKLSDMFGISKTQIHRILRMESWVSDGSSE